MKHFLIGIAAGVLLCGVSLAQNTTPPETNNAPQPQPPQTQQSPAPAPDAQASSGQSLRIAPGSVIPVQLTKTIDAKKAKPGDEVRARVTQDMKAMNGEVLVPKDTKVVGHITADQPRSKEEKESRVGIAFDHVVTKSGASTVPMSIQAIIGTSNSPDNSANAQTPSTMPGTGGTAASSGAPMGRSPGMGTGGQTQPQTPSPTGNEYPSNPQAGANPRQPINGNTQGVVGISDLKLSTTFNTTDGSLVSSDKNNVKLESGTVMLLRVAQ